MRVCVCVFVFYVCVRVYWWKKKKEKHCVHARHRNVNETTKVTQKQLKKQLKYKPKQTRTSRAAHSRRRLHQKKSGTKNCQRRSAKTFFFLPHFHPSPETMNMDMINTTDDQPFCTGPGWAMLSGFQTTVHGDCLVYLFPEAVMNTGVRFAMAVVFTVVLASTNEFLRCFRALLASRMLWPGKLDGCLDLVVSALYMVQMMVAYWLMLLVMLYEYVLFIAILLGLGIGQYATRKLEKRFIGPGGYGSLATGGSSPCCGCDGGAGFKSSSTDLHYGSSGKV